MPEFTLNKYAKCDGDEKLPVHFIANLTNAGKNRIFVKGEFIIDEAISGPVEVYNLFSINILYKLHILTLIHILTLYFHISFITASSSCKTM